MSWSRHHSNSDDETATGFNRARTALTGDAERPALTTDEDASIDVLRQQNLASVLDTVLVNKSLDSTCVLVNFPVAPLHRATLKLLGGMNKQ